MRMRRIIGAALLAIAAFMLIGFLGADLEQPPLVILMTLLVGVGIPGALGVILLRGGASGDRERLNRLRLETIEAEVLRLASASGGRLAAVEVVRDLGVSLDDATIALESLMRRGQADVEITPSGGIVYAFPEIRLLDEKSRATGLLDD